MIPDIGSGTGNSNLDSWLRFIIIIGFVGFTAWQNRQIRTGVATPDPPEPALSRIERSIKALGASVDARFTAIEDRLSTLEKDRTP